MIALDPTDLAQLDALARRLGIQEVGDDRVARARAEVVRRLLVMWEAQARPLRLTGPDRGELGV